MNSNFTLYIYNNNNFLKKEINFISLNDFFITEKEFKPLLKALLKTKPKSPNIKALKHF